MKVYKATLWTTFVSDETYSRWEKIETGETRYRTYEEKVYNKTFSRHEEVAFIAEKSQRLYAYTTVTKNGKVFTHSIPADATKYADNAYAKFHWSGGQITKHPYATDEETGEYILDEEGNKTLNYEENTTYDVVYDLLIPLNKDTTAPKTIADAERISELEKKAKAWDEYQAALTARRVREARKKEAAEAAKKSK